MSQYSKLIAAVVGNIVAIVLVYAATKGFGACTTAGDATTCTLFGFSAAQITGAVMFVINSAAVHFAPANTVS